MIKNCINIEGVLNKEALKTISLNQCKIYTCNYVIKILNDSGLKDIYQISIDSNLKNKNIFEFKDSSMISLYWESNFKILYIENNDLDNVNYVQESTSFNYMFKNKWDDTGKIDIFLIDAFFNIINCKEINCNLTYLFKFSSSETFENQSIISENSLLTESFIILNREFF